MFEDGSRKLLHIAHNYIPMYSAQYPRRLEYSLMGEL
jgi:hypothetical protein